MKMPFTLDAPVETLEVMQEGAPETIKLSTDEMLAEHRAGRRPSVTFRAVTYVQEPNLNHVRVHDSDLEAFAASFTKKPFLVDHGRAQSSRGGTILESKLVERDGKKAIEQTIKAVKPWAVESVLDGTFDRFSPGWVAEDHECGSCGKQFFKCGHSLVDLGTKGKNGKLVEILTKGSKGMEVSAVTIPAGSGTGVLDTLQLMQQSAALKPQLTQEDPMREKVYCLLGLTAETSEADALVALEQRLSASVEKVPAAMLTALELNSNASNDEAIAAVVTLKAPGNFISAQEHASVVDKLADLEADGRVAEAMRLRKVTPAGKEWALKFAKENPAGFEAFLKHSPVNGPPIAPGPNPPNPPPPPKPEDFTELAAHVTERMGVTKEEYLAVLKSQPVN